MAAQDYAALAQTLYVTYFGRPGDYFGMQSFQAQLDAMKAPKDLTTLSALTQADKAGTTALSKLVNSFNSSKEATDMYGTDTSPLGVSKFVEAIYLHVLNRAPDPEGWKFWVDAISSGTLPRATAAAAIADGASKNTTPQGVLDAKTVSNKIAVATDFTNSLVSVAQINGYSGNQAAATAAGMLSAVDSTTNVADYHASVVATVDTVVAGSIPSVISNLTIGVDTVNGTNGNDAINAIIGGAAGTDTLTTLDLIDGGAGIDTLNVNALTAVTGTSLNGVTIKNVENISFRSAAGVTFDTTASTISGVTKVAVTQATTVNLTAGSATALDVANASGNVALHGGSTQTVASAGATDITLDGAAGAIKVTDAAQGIGNIAIDGGTSVSVTSKGFGAGAIAVGGNAAPTGAVAITATGAAAAAAGGAAALGTIDVAGGTKVAVIVSATSSDAAALTDTDATGTTINQGNITVVGDATKTTEVTVKQTAEAAHLAAVAAVAGATEAGTVTFADVVSGAVVTVGGLTFTAAKALTGAQVAAAFANLKAGATQGSAFVANGVYSGTFSPDFSTGAVATAGSVTTVSFTGKASTNVADLAVAGVTTTTTTQGITAVDAEDGVLGVVAGAVDIQGAKIATATVESWGANSGITSNSLTTLNLTNSFEDFTILNTAATSLTLNLDRVGNADDGAAALDIGSTYATVKVNTANNDSIVTLAAANAIADLSVAGTKVLDLGASTLGALKTLTVTGSAGVKANASGANVTAVDTTGTTGNSTVTIDASKATFAGGAGVDKVTTATAPTKAISLGAGNDTLTFVGVSTATAALNGGDGTDTIAFADAATAATATVDATLAGKLTSFEKLGITTFGLDATVNLANLNNINSVVIGGGSAAATTLTLDKMAANGTVEIDGADLGTVAVKLADATGSADVLNVLLKNGNTTNFGVVKAAGVETINLTATDSTATTINTHTVDVLAAAAKSIVVTGNANVTFVADAANVALTSLDGSAMTGKLVASTNGTVAETITGGSAADTLTSIGNGDKLIGGAGNDMLIVTGNLVTLTGGAGNDTFAIGAATTNVNSYATITDLSVGDIIKFADVSGPAAAPLAESFAASKVSLADTAVFQDYANAAINATNAGAISWFQVGGNTYVVENVADGSSFANGSDVIVKITGSVDLSHASFNAATQTLVIVA